MCVPVAVHCPGHFDLSHHSYEFQPVSWRQAYLTGPICSGIKAASSRRWWCDSDRRCPMVA